MHINNLLAASKLMRVIVICFDSDKTPEFLNSFCAKKMTYGHWPKPWMGSQSRKF